MNPIGTKPRPDMSGWAVEAVSRAELEIKSWPRTRADVVACVNKIFAWLPEPDYVCITFFRKGPFLKPEEGEENNLSCWHYEPEEETFGYMLKWHAGDAVAYKFVERENLPSQICELLNSGVTRIHANHHHGQVEYGDAQPL